VAGLGVRGVLGIDIAVQIACTGVVHSRGCGGTRIDCAKVVRVADSMARLSSLLAGEV
jgi:hypothetical protein